MGGDRRQMMEDAADDKFPEGLRILVVDDDRVCLTVLEALLHRCKYQPTTVMDAKTALRMLMAGKQQFDLVITDVRMPDMDGFKLLELIRLQMDLPVIMISVDCNKKVVMKGIDHGASDFMVKPVCTHELKNIWQHVQRWRNPKAISHIGDHDSDVQRVQPATADKSKLLGNKRNAGDDSNKHNESTCISATHRKPRVTWTIKLHNKFLEAINQIGLDRAVPKKKYRLHLKRVNSNPSGDVYERWNSSYNMNNKGNFMHNHEHGRWSASSGDTASWSTNNYGATGHLAPPMNTQSNFYMGRLPMQIEKAPFISNTTSVGGFTEQMAPFNMPSNTSSVGTMLNGSSALDASRTSTKDTHLVNSERTTSMLHNLQTDDFFSLTQLLDCGDGGSILPMQEGALDHQPLNDQLNEINAFSIDDILSNMNLEDFTGDDAIVEEP
ncbi:two-component response regulator ORR24-like [Triticum aestivum]|uniref:two-component response regulator ORR24-like n=1 Tax=Triticum aestivum TaxID=4565 RepID=UPI001D011FD5|nr:two-component response regulator ORR24-like [Triticum aestivum]